LRSCITFQGFKRAPGNHALPIRQILDVVHLEAHFGIALHQVQFHPIDGVPIHVLAVVHIAHRDHIGPAFRVTPKASDRFGAQELINLILIKFTKYICSPLITKFIIPLLFLVLWLHITSRSQLPLYHHGSLTVRRTIDANKVQATYEHGVLKVYIPKSEWVKPKQIPIQVKEAVDAR
jgi:hypothetical protein